MMTDSCGCAFEAGNARSDLPVEKNSVAAGIVSACPACGKRGKRVPEQTVKALLSVSLIEMRAGEYIFCKTQNCPVVYFSSDGAQTFTTAEVRVPVFQKEPDNKNGYVCYCFQHKVGDFHAASAEARAAIIENINQGIRAGQCACDLRNPQGSCCLGNARLLVEGNE
jgi:hypothetical protein